MKKAIKNARNKWSYIKHFKLNSLFWRTFTVIAILLVTPSVIIGSLYYSSTYASIKKEIVLEISSMLDETKNMINNTLGECDMLSSYIASSSDAQKYIFGTINTESLANLTTLAKTLPFIYKYIDSVYIYSSTGTSILSDGKNISIDELTDTNWLNDYENTDNIRGAFISRKKNDIYPALITIIKPIYIADEKKGAVILNINSLTLYNSIVSNRYKQGQEFFITDADNRIILSKDVSDFHRTPEELGFAYDNTNNTAYRINESSSLILSDDSGKFGFKYISTYPKSLYENRLSGMILHILFISLTLLVLCFIVAYVISSKSYSPLSDIITILDSIAPVVDMSPEYENELKYILNSIQTQIEDKEKMSEILEERMKMLRKAQYEMLQAQINPHFLYNTLDTINWMAYSLVNSENPVSTSLVTLASFFRNTASTTSYLISVADEIRFTKDYLSILELRYEDLFDVKWDIDESIYTAAIIKICLQPIIENAVYHGLKPKGQKGLLTISGSRIENKIVFIVRDDGVGMDNDSLAELNSRLSGDLYSITDNHIGITNVNKRIKTIFGNDYGIRVDSKPDSGTSVYITIPFEEQAYISK